MEVDGSDDFPFNRVKKLGSIFILQRFRSFSNLVTFTKERAEEPNVFLAGSQLLGAVGVSKIISNPESKQRVL